MVMIVPPLYPIVVPVGAMMRLLGKFRPLDHNFDVFFLTFALFGIAPPDGTFVVASEA